LIARNTAVIPGHRAAMNPEPRGSQRDVGPWVPDRAPRVRNDEECKDRTYGV
jgi:hypothetical protein